MGDDHHGGAVRLDAIEQLGDVLAVGAIEFAGRFVGQQQTRMVGQRAGDRHALRLAPDSCDGRWSARCARPT